MCSLQIISSAQANDNDSSYLKMTKRYETEKRNRIIQGKFGAATACMPMS